MLKKNMRKRLLAGALATIMALTMCPTWALADDEGVTTLPDIENSVPVVDSAPAVDPTETPDVPSSSDTEAPAEDQNPAPAPSDDGANGGTDVAESGNNSSSNENDSQNNDAESNAPENEISVQEPQVDLAWWKPQPQEAMYFILLPKRGTPKTNADQGQENYLPSSDNKALGITGSDGGVLTLNADTGYEGFLTDAGKKKVRYIGDSVTDIEHGLNDSGYLDVPDNLGFFTPSNWNGNTYTPETHTTIDARNALLGESFNGTGFQIVWYTIKHQSDGYHVDGYLKGVDVNVTYHSNFGDDDTYVVTATTGDEYQALTTYGDTSLPERSGYTFVDWYKDANCTEVYEPTTLMGDLHLYAKWVKTAYNVEYYVDGEKVGNTETYKAGTDVAIRDIPTKEGYTFSGWTSDDAAFNSSGFKMPARNVTIKGTFVANEYNVTYKVDGAEYATDTYKVDAGVVIRDIPTKEGYTFSGWTSDDAAFNSSGFKMPARNVTIKGTFTQNKHEYTINKHFYNEKGVEVKVVNGEPQTAVENTEIKNLYTANTQETFENQTYVYVSGLTTVTENLEKLIKDVTIDLHYYLDVKGGEKPDENGNGTPDAWEYRLAFKVVNGEWNNGGSADIVVYVPFKDYKNGETLKEVVVPITSIPAVGDKPNSGYRAGSWDTTPVGNAKVEKDTVFTYTYAKKSSSGGGGGGGSHKPTVTIPDDVPTGLNGDDHYAYIVGYPDSTVRPQNGITRAEVATIFFRLLTDETRNANSTKSNSYSDVAAGAWYNHAVSTLSAMGIVKGDSHGKFNPNAPITRAEFAAIAARFDDKANTTAVDFSDIASHWAKNEISAAANNGWINGYTDGTFRPNNKITRAEAMTLVNRVLKRLPETAEDLHNDMIKWSDNSDTSAWYYLAVQEATNSHYYDLKGNKHEKWSKLRETRDWTELEK